MKGSAMTPSSNSSQPFDVSDRVILITGGGGFLGRVFVKAFVTAGAKVAVVDLDPKPALASVCEAGISTEESILLLEADIKDPAAVQGCCLKIEQRWRLGIDVLVNSAAIDPKFDAGVAQLQSHTFETLPLELWTETLAVNLTGTFLCCQAVGNIMRQQGKGNIINVASAYGMVAPDQRLYEQDGETKQSLFKPVAYPVSKAGILHLTRYLATYWANTGIRVNSLSPHGVFNSQPKQFLRRFAERSPMGRMALPDEIAGPLLFLASDASSYINGANLVVDGGWTAW